MDDSSADDLRRQMEQVRAELVLDSQRLAESAQQLSDWRYYVRRYPWIVLAATAAIGYLVVPKRRSPPAADAETVAQLLRQHQLEVRPPRESQGLLQSAVSTLGSTLLRAGLTYLGHQAGQVLANVAAGAQRGFAQPAAAPSQQPVEHSP